MNEVTQPGGDPTDKPDQPGSAAAPQPGAPTHEVHIGPITWVPELKVRGGKDPWAHRKGEPRPMALLWACYLMLATLVTVLLVRGTGLPGTSTLVYACRALLVLLLIGVCILWPMARLSQAFPARPFRSAAADALVVLLPAQAIIWPTALLTRWPWEVVGGIALLVACWALLSAGLIAGAYVGSGSHSSRAAWMIAGVLLATAAPAAMLLANLMNLPQPHPRLLLLSPVTAVYMLTDAPSGLTPRMAPIEWLAVSVPAVAGLLLVALAWLAGPPPRRDDPEPRAGAAPGVEPTSTPPPA